MSSVLHRTHSFSFERNSLIVVVGNIVVWFGNKIFKRAETPYRHKKRAFVRSRSNKNSAAESAVKLAVEKKAITAP